MNGEKIKDATKHPAFKPIIDARARFYDLAHETKTRDTMSYVADEKTGERNNIGYRLPHTQQDWWDKRKAVDMLLKDIGGVTIRVGDETIGEMWSLFDGKDVLNEVDPRFAENIEKHIQHAMWSDSFHVSANTDPKGDRSKRPQDQDRDMLLHLVRSCYLVEPGGAPILAGKPVINPNHRIQGGGYSMTDLPLLQPELVDGYIQVKDDEAIRVARRLAKEEGIFAGFSSGANVAAALQLVQTTYSGKTIVVILSDSGLKYLSTDLWR